MPRIKTSSSEAQKKLDTVFPSRGLKLLSYAGAREPCVILCPTHGEQRVSSFANTLRSKLGCPECGKASQQDISGESLRNLASKRKSAENAIKQLLTIPESLGDTEYKIAVMNLLKDWR